MSKLRQNKQVNWQEIERLAWFKALYLCPQEPDYHAEGDVGIHTRMVVEALLDLPEFQTLPTTEQDLLFNAALVHDIAKPACTIIENGQISSPKHAQVGEKMARDMFWDAEFDWRERLCALVRLHGLPIWALDKQLPHAAVIAASLRVPNRLTYLLAKADVLGRVSNTQADFLERVEFFKALCEENDCFEQSKQFLNEHSRFKFFRSQSEHPAELFDDTHFEITILSGIAGSGKDTYASQYSYENNIPIVSLDSLRNQYKVKHGDSKGQGQIIQKALEIAKAYCAKKQSFIWNSTNLTREMRSGLLSTFGVYNPRFRIVYVETSQENIFARRKEDIPMQNLQKMFRILDIPQLTEAHEVVYLRNE